MRCDSNATLILATWIFSSPRTRVVCLLWGQRNFGERMSAIRFTIDYYSKKEMFEKCPKHADRHVNCEHVDALTLRHVLFFFLLISRFHAKSPQRENRGGNDVSQKQLLKSCSRCYLLLCTLCPDCIFCVGKSLESEPLGLDRLPQISQRTPFT